MDISFEYYKIFYHVAKLKNMTLAARTLQGSQPNVSRAIRLLEDGLGCRLIIRSNRGISLTPEGERLYAHVRIAVEQLIAGEHELKLSAGLQGGMVTIGASETALRLLLLPVLNRFRQSYPAVRIRILNHLTRQAVSSVENGLVDFSVVTSPVPVSRPLRSTEVTSFRDIMVCGSDFSALTDHPLSLKDLQGFPLVGLGSHTLTYQFYEAFYETCGLTYRPELEAATTDQILPMVRSNLGLGFLPEIFAREALAEKEIFRIPLIRQIPKRFICFVENETRPLSIAAGELKKHLLSYSK